MEYGSETMATTVQESHVRLGARAQERLYSGENGTSASDIMLANGTLSREMLLGEFFKVRAPEDAPVKK